MSVLGGHAACIFRRPCRLLLICSRWDVVVVIVVVVVVVVVAWRPCRLYFSAALPPVVDLQLLG